MLKINRVISRLVRGALLLPQTLYINFKVFPVFQAFKFPILVMGPCRFKGLKRGNVIFKGKIYTGVIQLAVQKTSKRGISVNRKTHLIIDGSGKIIFHGSAKIGAGTSICASEGTITIGQLFSCNVNCFIFSKKSIYFEKNVLLGWNINIRDNDGHPIYDRKGNLINPNQEIKIGKNVWIASYVDILKGVSLAEGTIVGTKSLVTKSELSSYNVIAGIPANVIKKEVFWKHE